jgi:Short C-terminal domain
METSSASKATSMKVVGFVWAGMTMGAISTVSDVIEGKGSLSLAALLSVFSLMCLWVISRIYENYKYSLAIEAKEADEQSELARKKEEFIVQFSEGSEIKVLPVTYLGGSGFDGNAGEQYLLCKKKGCIYLADVNRLKEHKFKLDEFLSLEISGAGTETTNAGIVGGGFGIEGMLKGMVVASVLNAITTKSQTNTYMRFSGVNKEMFLHLDCVEPAELRMILSSIFVEIENSRLGNKPISASDELAKLFSLFKEGVLTQAEFEKAKANLLN